MHINLITHTQTYAHGPFDLYPPVHLLPKVIQSWRALGDTVVSVTLCLLAAENVTVQQELTHELLPVVHIKVAVALQRVAKLAARCHDALHSFHEQMAHVRQISHVLHVSLRGHVAC